MIKIKEEIYVWLSIIEDLNYLIYLQLIKIFNSTINLYNFSKDEFKFEEYLKSNNFNLNENLKTQISNNTLKQKARGIYNYLKSKNIKIVPINSKFYPENLKNIFSPPLCIYVIGNLELLKNKKVYVYENENISKYANKITTLLYKQILNPINYLILNKNLNIESVNLLRDISKIKLKEGINIYYNSICNDNYIKDTEIKSGILDLLIIPEANYDKNISIFVDCFLELGKEICIFPNEIFNKNAYFSNYLIKNGANILTNIYQVKEVLNNL